MKVFKKILSTKLFFCSLPLVLHAALLHHQRKRTAGRQEEAVIFDTQIRNFS
jgi:hypothetical protein